MPSLSSQPSSSSLSLKPPTIHRARASSSSVRPPLSIATLEPRVALPTVPAAVEDSTLSPATDSRAQGSSDSFASQQPPIPSYQPSPLPSPSPSSSSASSSSTSSMFPVLVRRTVDLWHVLRYGVEGKHANLLDTPDTSPRSSTDTEYILPLSSSPRKAAFAPEDFAPTPQLRTQFRLMTFSSVRVPIISVPCSFHSSCFLLPRFTRRYCLSSLCFRFQPR